MKLKDDIFSLTFLGSFFFLLNFLLSLSPNPSFSASLPANLANDPPAKALGPTIVNSALKEGEIYWYGGTTSQSFLRKGGKQRFEKRYGIKINHLSGRNRDLTERLRAEHATGRKVADVFEGNDQYMLELYEMGAVEKFRPPAPGIDGFNKKIFIQEPKGYWWPVHISAQALVANKEYVKAEEFPKSYWDIINPKWKGRVGIRDPRKASGGAWQFLHIYNHPDLGIKYIKQLKEVVDPFLVPGGSSELRDAVILGQFVLGFGGRAEFLLDAPKDIPLAYIVPKEGLVWTPSSITLIKNAPHPNAAKLLMTWFYEVENLQLWADARGRMVPHKDVKMAIPEMDIRNYEIMDPIPTKHLANPKFFFLEMEKIFGTR